MKLGDVPFEDLRIGDRIVSCTGKDGYIAALFPEGVSDFWGKHGDGCGRILMVWSGMTFSIQDHLHLEVEHVGSQGNGR